MAVGEERTGQVIEERADFKSDAQGEAARWAVELEAAEKDQKKWREESGRIVKRFLDRRDSKSESETRLNLFTANVVTQRALMFGKTPKADVVRRWEDPNDNIGRVCALMLERLLNTDVEEGSDGYVEAIGLALDDKQLVGMGNVRVRYEVEVEEPEEGEEEEKPALTDASGKELAPAVPAAPKKKEERVAIDYVHWRDQLWSPARTFNEVRWWAFRVYLTKDEAAKRWGKAVAKKLPLAKKGVKEDSLASQVLKNDPWARVEVWEIWSKADKKVYWFVKGYREVLQVEEDPLELDRFWPFPRPMMANLTTDQFLPRPDFSLAQDLYNEIDYLSSRITKLERAVKVVGCYDASSEGVQRMLTEGTDNTLIPVENYAAFAEKGGVQGAISWLPVKDVVDALNKLVEQREVLVRVLYEVTGMSDIMRGQAESGATATEQALKARFASVRMQHAQDEFARFCSEVLELKSEVISKHFDVQTIIDCSNIASTDDAPLAEQAALALKDERIKYRIEVKPENLSITDFAQLKEERASFIQGITMFLQAATPLVTAMPGAAPFLIDIMKWSMAAFRGSAAIEPVFTKAAQAITQDLQQKAMQPPQPDPKLMVAQAKVKGEQARAQADMQVAHAKLQTQQQSAAIDLQKQAMKAQLDINKTVADLHLRNQQQVQQLATQAMTPPRGR